MGDQKKQNSRDQLSDLIRRIYQYSPNDEKQWTNEVAESFAQEFIEYYEGGNYNLYSATYKWLSEAPEGTADYLDKRLSDIEAVIRENGYEHLRNFTKLRDYIVLEAARANNFSYINETAKKGEKSWEQVEKLNIDIQNEMLRLKQDAQEDRKNTNTQSITVLSIFTGIAMAFFGGFSLIGSAFNNLGNGGTDLFQILILVVLIGFILFNTIYALICVACRISGVPPTQPDHIDCSKCQREDRCDKIHPKFGILRWGVQFRRKYPFACAVNIVLLLLLIVFILVDYIQ